MGDADKNTAKKKASEDREARLKAALKANLQKRKSQAQERAHSEQDKD